MTAEIRLGTSSFTAAGWQGAFYPVRMKQADYLGFYSARFDTVEVDSTFYATPTIVPIRQSQRHWRAVDQPVWQPLIISARNPKRMRTKSVRVIWIRRLAMFPPHIFSAVSK